MLPLVLIKQYFGVDALQTNITLADMWLRGMAIGAQSQNVSIQYCMPYPNMILTASALSNVVTNARASGDYGPNKGQWEIGITSLFYWALGILPMKDGFYSSTLAQKGGYPEGPELRPDLQALISTLSCAMVAPMDGLNYINATRVKTACRSDGTILKPDVPVRTSDACFHRGPHADPATHDPSTCLIYITHTDIQGMGRVRYVFRDETEKVVTPAMAHIGDAGDVSDDFALYNWYTGELRLFGVLNEVAPGYEGHSYSMIVPILPGGWIFLGEVDKYVPISRLRFSKVLSSNADKLEVVASGVPGEQFRVCVAHTTDLTRIHCRTETIESTKVQSLSFDRFLLGVELANSPM
jgi:hypothetical protein